MPTLDVSDLLDDPLFQSSIDVTRTTVTVASTGRSTTSQTVFPGVPATVLPSDGTGLSREPDGRLAVGGIMVYLRMRLYSGQDAIEPDVIAWRGREYTVDVVNDYGEFGAGYTRVGAKLRSLT